MVLPAQEGWSPADSDPLAERLFQERLVFSAAFHTLRQEATLTPNSADHAGATVTLSLSRHAESPRAVVRASHEHVLQADGGQPPLRPLRSEIPLEQGHFPGNFLS